MDKPLIHDVTLHGLQTALKSNHHALALMGPYGTGKSHIAKWLANEFLGEGYRSESVRTISPADGTLGIDQIREVTAFLKLKTSGKAAVRRVVIIEDAHMMTLEAQNSLLKSLEEPPEDTRFILTVAGQRSLLPTVYSRIYGINVLPVSEIAFTQYRGKSTDESDIKRAYAISGGLPGLGLALLEDKSHQLTVAITEAKALLGKPTYERLLEVDNLSKDREKIPVLLFALKRILSAGIPQASGTKLARILGALKAVHRAEADLSRNPNTKLTVTKVMLNL